MSYRLLLATLLLSILLFSCEDDQRPPSDGDVSPALTLTPTQSVFYLDKSALAYGVFQTEALSLTIDISNTVPGQFQDFADVSVADGSSITSYEVASGEETIVHRMPLGEKYVIVTAGLQTKFRGQIVGVFINKITFAGSATRIKQGHKRLLVYGDSLAIGGNVDHLSAQAWPVLLRKDFSVPLEAYGYRALYDDTFTAEARSELVSKISAWMPDYVWLAIGGNDYAFELWSAREFGDAYVATLDAIHASNPQAILFAQSPILRADEPANRFGDNLQSYRQQIANACLAEPVWCRYVDGLDTAFPQPDELDLDGIHLTTESSRKYAKAVLNSIGK